MTDWEPLPAREELEARANAQPAVSLKRSQSTRPNPLLEDRGQQCREVWLLSQDCPEALRRYQHEPWLTQLPFGLIEGLLKTQAGIGVGKLKDEVVGALGPGGTQLQFGGWEGERVAQCLLFR